MALARHLTAKGYRGKKAKRKTYFYFYNYLKSIRVSVLMSRTVFRIRIGSGFYQVSDPVPDPNSESGFGNGSRRAKMTHKSKKIKKFHVLKC
jgi:hypothetical protein